jgi:hypothetical protein
MQVMYITLHEEWTVKYPAGYIKFQQLSGMTITGLFGRFFKHIRRHGQFEAGSWNLTTGELVDHMKFVLSDPKKPDGPINMTCGDYQTVFNTLGDAWKFYVGRLEKQFKLHEV